MTKWFKRAATLGSVVALGLVGAPSAEAVGPVYGGGQVIGTVTLSPGIPLVGFDCTTQHYDFSSVFLNGTISDGVRTVAGSIGTSGVNGDSSCETAAAGAGTVNTADAPAGFSGGGAGNASGSFFGTYQRVGSHVLVNLTGTMTLCGTVGGCATYGGVPINLDATEFIPTNISADGRVTAAQFAGQFHVGAGA